MTNEIEEASAINRKYHNLLDNVLKTAFLIVIVYLLFSGKELNAAIISITYATWCISHSLARIAEGKCLNEK